MGLSKCDAIRELLPDKTDWKIKARVLPTWKGKPISDTEPGGIHFILIDDGKTRIYAYLGPKLAKELNLHIVEGKIYIIKNFSVSTLRDNQSANVLRNKTHIYFEPNTTIVEVLNEDSLIPKVHFDIFAFECVEPLATDKTFLIDIIGVVETVLPTHNFINKSTGMPQCWVVFFINNGCDGLKVKFWDDHAKKFTEAMAKSLEQPVIMNIACAKPNLWEGDLCVSNTPATRFFLNCDHYTVKEFRKSLNLRNKPIHTMLPNESTTPTVARKIKVAKLKDFFTEQPTGEVTCTLTIDDLNVEKNWFIVACPKCKQSVEWKETRYRCTPCAKNIPIAPKRFRLFTTASDETGSISLLLRDHEVHTFTGKTVIDFEGDSDYKEDVEKEGVVIPIPSDIEMLKSKTFDITLIKVVGDDFYIAQHLKLTYDFGTIHSDSTHGECNPDEYTISKDIPQTGGTIDSPCKTATPLTKSSATKRKLRKKKDVVPTEMDDNVPLTQLMKIPKKERIIKEVDVVSVQVLQVKPKRLHIITYPGDKKYGTNDIIPVFDIFALSCLQPYNIDSGKNVKTIGQIIQVDTEELWYETVCPICKEAVQHQHAFHYCQKCNMNFDTPLIRFKMVVYIEDELSVVGLNLIHDVVKKLLHNSSNTEPGDLKDNTNGNYPEELLHIVGLKKMFLLIPKPDNLNGNSFFFNCCDVEDIT